MVLLAAAVCNRTGKALISRQFVEMTRSRIEGLLAAFPKLMNPGKQHTFVETESVRYVFQPIEKLYILLITTKASNILEDLETLRLFAKVIPEYCRNYEESEILDQSFPLIFAFDEIVALGYRENVNLALIRTFTDMDSHEERVFQAVRQTQEKEAQDVMRRKVKEIQQRNRELAKSGRTSGWGLGRNVSGVNPYRNDTSVIETSSVDLPDPSYVKQSRPFSTSKALQLGSKKRDVDQFVGKIELEGEKVLDVGRPGAIIAGKPSPQTVANPESVHISVEEKLLLEAGRDGGLHSMEVHGMMKVRVSDEDVGRIKICTVNKDNRGFQIQTHPNIDKKVFLATGHVVLKNSDKPFPLMQDVGVLKWRLHTQDQLLIPFSVNCWTSETNDGCDVNMEYELEQDDLLLEDVCVTLHWPSAGSKPVVGDCDGEHLFDAQRRELRWLLPFVDSTNKTGSLELTVKGGQSGAFFPVNVSFTSRTPYCDIQVTEVKPLDDDDHRVVKFSCQTLFYADKYEIV